MKRKNVCGDTLLPNRKSVRTHERRLLRSTQREIFSKSYQIKQKSDCIYDLPIDLKPNGRPFSSKSIGK